MNRSVGGIVFSFLLSGCAGLQFQGEPTDDALSYYEPQPYLLIQRDGSCTYTAKVVSLPGRKRSVKFNSGLGSADLNLTMTEDGLITTVGQNTDTKVPDTIQAVTGLAKLIGGELAVAADETKCPARAAMFRIVNGRVDASDRVNLTF